MSDLISLNDFISNQIAGDWGKEKEDNRNNLKVYCIRGADINAVNEGSYTNLPIRYIESKNKLKILKEGNIIIEISGGSPSQSTGRVCYIRSFLPNIICSNFCRAYEIKNEHSPKFFYYLIKNIYNSDVFFNFESKTSGIKNLLIESALDNIKVPKYNLPTQQSIAKVLSDLDYKIELNNKINKELESMAKTLYDYWFVQFDFPNEDGKPYKSSGGKMVYNNELKREIPEGWEVKKLGDIIKKYADKSTHIESKNILNEGSYPVITQDNGDLISGFTNENNPIEDVPLIVFGDHSCTLRYIDFPFFRGADGTQIMYFEEDLTIYVYLFLQMIITQIPGYGKYERHYKYLKEFNIIIPKAKFLSEFQKIVEPIFNKISKSRLQNQHLTTLRDWLLPMLMNGQVTVKDVEHK
jgi:type I restriction enzyme S subunit